MSAALQPGAGAPPMDAERAFLAACRLDVAVRKAGNVSRHSAGHGMQAEQFVASAHAAAPALCRPQAALGQRIEAAVRASWQAAGCNTNLGIVLLSAPLAAASQQALPAADGQDQQQALQLALGAVLAALGPADAQACFCAIALANPGGLGHDAQHDVRQPPRIGLLQAMQQAAHRDSIARQYANGCADLFGAGLAALGSSGAPGLPEAVIRTYLAFAGGWPDSHIVRKHGAEVAHSVMATAQGFAARAAAGEPLHDAADWLAWDAALKQGGHNPGTSADLTVATLMLAAMLGRLPLPPHWHGT